MHSSLQWFQAFLISLVHLSQEFDLETALGDAVEAELGQQSEVRSPQPE